jgi:hypothetical protein
LRQNNPPQSGGWGGLLRLVIACIFKPPLLGIFTPPLTYGGEEFMIMLIQVNYGGFERILERIRKNVERLAIEHKSSDVADVMTISIGGIFLASGDGCTPEKSESFRMADNCLYEAKKGGRNRIVCAKTVAERHDAPSA